MEWLFSKKKVWVAKLCSFEVVGVLRTMAKAKT